MTECDHKFVYRGLVYSHSAYPLPGTGAHARIYEDAYFCEKCLEERWRNAREIGNSYQKPIAGSIPK